MNILMVVLVVACSLEITEGLCELSVCVFVTSFLVLQLSP